MIYFISKNDNKRNIFLGWPKNSFYASAERRACGGAHDVDCCTLQLIAPNLPKVAAGKSLLLGPFSCQLLLPQTLDYNGFRRWAVTWPVRQLQESVKYHIVCNCMLVKGPAGGE